jgi:hypothetical protein
MPGPHDKIIAHAAKTTLLPLGFQRKGRSRLWFADHGWRLTVIEFQPSAWSKGSYLNVAVQWLWVETDTFGFDFGGRLAEFVEYQSDDQFAPAALRLARSGADEARQLDQTFSSLEVTAEVLLNEVRNRPMQGPGHPGWMAYHAGVAAGLVGRTQDAEEMFGRVLKDTRLSGSMLHSAAERVARLAGESRQLRSAIALVIENQRNSLRLPPLDEPAL